MFLILQDNLYDFLDIYFFSQNGHGYLDENIDVLEEGEKKEEDGQQRSYSSITRFNLIHRK